MPRGRAVAAVVLIMAAALGAWSAHAQDSGRISGTIRVEHGAPIGGAGVTVTNQGTGAARTVRSTPSGSYEAVDLPAGLYTVAAEAQGFRKVTRADQRLASGATLVVDISLEVKLAAEVTVTAMKREDTLRDAPVSIAAPTEDVLRERGVQTIEDVAANVAGFSVQNLGPGQSQVAMRGISSGQIARDQPGVKEQVGAYLDESVLSMSLFTPDIDLFDVGRVEVLRGPQGTLFGSGSLSGTVRYISNQPELATSRVFGEFTASSLSSGSQGGNVKLGVNVPLGTTSALRVVGYYESFAGYMDSVQPDFHIEKDVNGGHRAGLRASVQIAPNDRVTITPRLVYQRVKMDGWNRIDAFNILANPYTTSRRPVSLGEREQFTQIPEPYTDAFVLGDLNVRVRLGDLELTSNTSYSHRDIVVVRDATALTASITGGTIGLPASIYTLDAPLDDATKGTSFTQELRLAGGKDALRWVAGAFYATSDRIYGQSLFVGGFEQRSGIPTTGLRAPKDVLYFSDLDYDLRQLALFGEATVKVGDKLSITGGLRYYSFDEDKAQIFDGIFANDNNGSALVSQPGSTDASGVAPRLILSYKLSESTNLNAQVSRGFRLGGINDPINVPLCTPQDLVTFGGRESWDDETAWNYEIGSKSGFLGGRGSINVSAFYVDIQDLQAVVTAGSCSSRLVFNVPKARSIGGEIELAAALGESFDFSVSAGLADATLRSTLTSTDPNGTVSVVSGIEKGNRLPSVPRFQAAASATYEKHLGTEGLSAYLTGTYQHIGSRYTQVGDEVPGTGTVDLRSFGANTIGGPLTASTFRFDPLLPAYDLLNLRVGLRQGGWNVAFFVNNVTDERALLALDRERGLRARVGYLTNPPRTFGISTRMDF